MTKRSPATLTADPLERLSGLAQAEASRREAARAANRARFPALAEVIDRMGGRLIYAEDASGSIGKVPTLEPHLFEVSAETLKHMRDVQAMRRKKS